ncbi:hypothetical protein JTE90_028353 [Oedothorax gibbosus]|uniref:Uncharacterized protein n=1 Tax=Oedothorax gibbosus TaxID=931172 RepID=A0AAV6TYX5_9ARAC|nr:hypothetical protein JTE90_028353 [Oedothorax gibbosus]
MSSCSFLVRRFGTLCGGISEVFTRSLPVSDSGDIFLTQPYGMQRPSATSTPYLDEKFYLEPKCSKAASPDSPIKAPNLEPIALVALTSLS